MNFEHPYQEGIEENIIEKEGEGDIYASARKKAEVFLEKINFTDEKDIVEINPGNIEENPVFVSPGWGVTPKSQKEALETIATEGKRKVLTASFSREEKIREDEEKDIPVAELQKALQIIDIINKKGLDKVDAVGHSEGGLALAIAANLFPEKFKNLVFVSPAGMIGKDSYADLVKRFTIDEGIEEGMELLKNYDKSKLSSFYDYLKAVSKNFFKNPMLSHREIKAMSKLDIFEMTKRLKDKGIGVSLVVGANDKVLPIDEVTKYVNKDIVDNFVSTKGNHGSLIFNQKYGELVSDILSNMDRPKQRT